VFFFVRYHNFSSDSIVEAAKSLPFYPINFHILLRTCAINDAEKKQREKNADTLVCVTDQCHFFAAVLFTPNKKSLHALVLNIGKSPYNWFKGWWMKSDLRFLFCVRNCEVMTHNPTTSCNTVISGNYLFAPDGIPLSDLYTKTGSGPSACQNSGILVSRFWPRNCDIMSKDVSAKSKLSLSVQKIVYFCNFFFQMWNKLFPWFYFVQKESWQR
jgi:hypothetical protein